MLPTLHFSIRLSFSSVHCIGMPASSMVPMSGQEPQVYRGARWPKMTDSSGNDSPSAIGTLLCWQQPHPIFYTSLLRKTHPGSALLKEWTKIIEATAAFMADYLQYDEKQGLYVLGPPLIPV